MSKIQTLLLVDCDGTLLHKHGLYRPEDALANVRVFERQGMTFQVVGRPSAAAFLKHFDDKRVITACVTGGSSRNADFAFAVAELRIGRSFGAGEKLPVVANKWVLVDDNLSSSSDLHDKFAQILGKSRSQLSKSEIDEAIANNFVHCQTFRGEADNHPLTDLIPVISEKLGLS